ncbi:MAG TPA: cytochrome P450, partial [Actinoallomurus sp.]
MTEVADQQVSTFPMQRTCPFSPPVEYGELREKTPIARALLPSGQHAWLVTRHADVRAVLTDPRFSSDRRHPDFP